MIQTEPVKTTTQTLPSSLILENSSFKSTLKHIIFWMTFRAPHVSLKTKSPIIICTFHFEYRLLLLQPHRTALQKHFFNLVIKLLVLYSLLSFLVLIITWPNFCTDVFNNLTEEGWGESYLLDLTVLGSQIELAHHSIIPSYRPEALVIYFKID